MRQTLSQPNLPVVAWIERLKGRKCCKPIERKACHNKQILRMQASSFHGVKSGEAKTYYPFNHQLLYRSGRDLPKEEGGVYKRITESDNRKSYQSSFCILYRRLLNLGGRSLPSSPRGDGGCQGPKRFEGGSVVREKEEVEGSKLYLLGGGNRFVGAGPSEKWWRRLFSVSVRGQHCRFSYVSPSLPSRHGDYNSSRCAVPHER